LVAAVTKAKHAGGVIVERPNSLAYQNVLAGVLVHVKIYHSRYGTVSVVVQGYCIP